MSPIPARFAPKQSSESIMQASSWAPASSGAGYLLRGREINLLFCDYLFHPLLRGFIRVLNRGQPLHLFDQGPTFHNLRLKFLHGLFCGQMSIGA